MYSSYSEEGRCFTFDSRGTGYGRGDGVATVVLKLLSEAIKNNDPIRAIIRSSGVGQDGKTNGISVPNGEAQEQLIRATYARAGLDPSETLYVEAHGTGTAVGDPIEASAIGRSFAVERRSKEPVIVGSLKTNIGHTESVSGLAGLIKAVLIVENGLIPPNFDFRTPNPNIPLQQLNIKVCCCQGVRLLLMMAAGPYEDASVAVVYGSKSIGLQLWIRWHQRGVSFCATHSLLRLIPFAGTCDCRTLAFTAAAHSQ